MLNDHRFPGLLTAGLICGFLDALLIEGHTRWLPLIVAGLLCAAGVQAAISGLQGQVLMRWQLACAEEETGSFLSRILTLPVPWFRERASDETAGRFFLPLEAATLAGCRFVPVFLSAVPLAGFAAGMVFYQPLLAALAWMVSAVSVATAFRAARGGIGERANLRHFEGLLAAKTTHGWTVIENLKCGGGKGFLQSLHGVLTRIRNLRQRSELRTELFAMVSSLLNQWGMAGFVALGSGLIVMGWFTIGGLAACLVLWLFVQHLIREWLQLPVLLQNFEVNRMRQRDWPSLGGVELRSVRSASFESLEVKNLSFGYSASGEALLRDVSFCVRPGRRVVVTGSSGCGKSTLIHLLCGSLHPWSGEVLWNGTHLPSSQIPSLASVVQQDIHFFPERVVTNLQLGNPRADLAHALRVTGLEEIWAARAGEVMHDNGANFSGGQRQRLEIARALARESGLIILDEAMNGLDSAAVAQIQAELQRRGVAVLQVSHRRDVLREADEILVLDQGMIVERGTYATLSQGSLIFRQLVD